MRIKQQTGKANRANGLSFEDETDRTWYELQRNQVGVFRKTSIQANMVGGLWQPTGKGPFDRFGIIQFRDRVVPIYYEIKTHAVEQNKMPDRHTLPDKNEHQLRALRDFFEVAGDLARCFVIVDWRCTYPDGTKEAQMRLHPITAVIGRTLFREHSILSPNRNWFAAAMSPEYVLLSRARGFMYADAEQIPA